MIEVCHPTGGGVGKMASTAVLNFQRGSGHLPHVALQRFQAHETLCQRITLRHVYFSDEDGCGVHDGFDASEHRSRLSTRGVSDHGGFG